MVAINTDIYEALLDEWQRHGEDADSLDDWPKSIERLLPDEAVKPPVSMGGFYDNRIGGQDVVCVLQYDRRCSGSLTNQLHLISRYQHSADQQWIVDSNRVNTHLRWCADPD